MTSTILDVTTQEDNRSAACYPPTITLIPCQSTLTSPISFPRSTGIVISSMIELNCDTSLPRILKWTIKNCTSASCSFELDLGRKIPTTFSELYIPPRTLNYGIYELTLSVTMSDIPTLTSSSTVYIRIIATGIIPNLIQLGTSMITRGHDQDLFFDPGTFSIDPDQDIFDASVSH